MSWSFAWEAGTDMNTLASTARGGDVGSSFFDITGLKDDSTSLTDKQKSLLLGGSAFLLLTYFAKKKGLI